MGVAQSKIERVRKRGNVVRIPRDLDECHGHLMLPKVPDFSLSLSVVFFVPEGRKGGKGSGEMMPTSLCVVFVFCTRGKLCRVRSEGAMYASPTHRRQLYDLEFHEILLARVGQESWKGCLFVCIRACSGLTFFFLLVRHVIFNVVA